MIRSAMLILPAAALGYVGVAASSTSANAALWVIAPTYSTSTHGTNCACGSPGAIPQQASQQGPTTMAKQTNPAGLQNNDGLPVTKQR